MEKENSTKPASKQVVIKTCETCTGKAIKGERFCKQCKAQRLQKMKQDGYLTPKPLSSFRGSDSRENVNETKHGSGHG